MSLYPDVQAKAQAEIERVCGRSRLPEMADTDSLPYVQAIMYEVLRWHAIVPLSMPHVATEDDQYEGYFIPKGTTIIAVSGTIKNIDLPYAVPKLYRTNGRSLMILFFTGVG